MHLLIIPFQELGFHIFSSELLGHESNEILRVAGPVETTEMEQQPYLEARIGDIQLDPSSVAFGLHPPHILLRIDQVQIHHQSDSVTVRDVYAQIVHVYTGFLKYMP